jgi:DNA-binding NarL/FixJ family response regulator
MSSSLINVAIADDHTLFRKTLQNYMAGQDDINVVLQAADIQELLLLLKDLDVHVLLLGTGVLKLLGCQTVKNIKSLHPAVKILALSTSADLDLLSDLLEAGVNGIISQTDEPEELLYAIRSLASQRIYRSKLFTDVMYWNKQHDVRTRAGSMQVPLNEREKEILQLLWEEKSNKEIAGHLFLSVRSVEKIRQDMKEKIRVKSTVGLLKYAISQKIVSLAPQTAGNSYSLP